MVSLGVILSFFTGIALFGLFHALQEFIGFDFSKGLYYDFVLPSAIGLALSIFFVIYIKKRLHLYRTVWVAWFIGIVLAIIILLLIVSSTLFAVKFFGITLQSE